MSTKDTHDALIARAAQAVGNQTNLAAQLGVTQQSVSYWKRSRVPFEYGAAIEQITGGAVTRRELFPDDWSRLWPELAADRPAGTQQTQQA